MHRLRYQIPLAGISCFFLSFADAKNELLIINHFDQPIDFRITINPWVVPDLPTSFTLAPQEQIHSRVLNLSREAYFDGTNGGQNLVYWGVLKKRHLIEIHGYLSHGIAYSWKEGTVTFCTPAEYQKKHSC